IVADAYDDESTSINEVRVGQCVDIDLDGAALTSVERRDCDEPHDAEVYLVRRIDGFAEFPGERELDRRGVATCDETALERYAGSRSGDGTLSPWYVVPSKATWPAGDRTIVCLVTS